MAINMMISHNSSTPVQKAIKFTSEEFTDAPVSKVYIDNTLIWRPQHWLTIKFPANTLSTISYTTVECGRDNLWENTDTINSSETSKTLLLSEGDIILIKPTAKSGYVVTSNHTAYITITGKMTVNITTKAATKGKLIAPVVVRGNEGRVDGSYRFYGSFLNKNSVAVTMTARFYYISGGAAHQDRAHSAQSGRTVTLVANPSGSSGTTGATATVECEGRDVEQYAGKHLIVVKFSADGYEDSDYRFWSDYSSFVSSTAYTTGQIPELVLNKGDATYEGYGKYEDCDDDGDYDIELDLSLASRFPFNCLMIVDSPLGIETYNKVTSLWYYDVPPDCLSFKISCCDQTGCLNHLIHYTLRKVIYQKQNIVYKI